MLKSCCFSHAEVSERKALGWSARHRGRSPIVSTMFGTPGVGKVGVLTAPLVSQPAEAAEDLVKVTELLAAY